MNFVAKRRRRWGDNDRHFGPFTYARDKGYRPLTAYLSSGDGEGDVGCHLRVSAFGHTVFVELPAIIKPYRRKVVASSWDAETIERLGRNWYYDMSRREYGLSSFEGHFQVFYGRQTDDSSTEQRWGRFLPWTQWRFVRHSMYGLDGSHYWTDPKANGPAERPDFEERRNARDNCPSISFEFDDFDGERIVAKTRIEEREWKFGTGSFKWLSLFRFNKVVRSLDLEFSKETGRRKGSWKGGTVGHSIDMIPGELHEAAFRRYCAEHEMTFVATLSQSSAASSQAPRQTTQADEPKPLNGSSASQS